MNVIDTNNYINQLLLSPSGPPKRDPPKDYERGVGQDCPNLLHAASGEPRRGGEEAEGSLL